MHTNLLMTSIILELLILHAQYWIRERSAVNILLTRMKLSDCKQPYEKSPLDRVTAYSSMFILPVIWHNITSPQYKSATTSAGRRFAPDKFQKARQRVGFLIEAPSINSSMTAKENMQLHRIIKGIPNQELEDSLLQLVGLQNTKKKETRNFLLGMKQRLGIAPAFIGSPELLVLDEPNQRA